MGKQAVTPSSGRGSALGERRSKGVSVPASAGARDSVRSLPKRRGTPRGLALPLRPRPSRSERQVAVCCSSSESLGGSLDEDVFASGSSTEELLSYAVSLSNDASEEGTTIKLSGRDRGKGLLSDVAFALASQDLDVLSGSLLTKGANQELDDTFVVQKWGKKLDEAEFQAVEEAVLAACLKSVTLSTFTKSLSTADELILARAAMEEAASLVPASADEDGGISLAAAGEGESEATGEGEGEGMKWTFATVGSIALVNLAAALFGSNQVLIKLTETETSPSTLNLVRFGIAALAFLPFGIKTGAFKRPKLLTAATELATYLFIGYTAQVLGLGMTSASRGAVMAEFAVLIVPFWAKLSGEKIPNIVWYASVIALLGVVLVTEADGASSGFNLGDSLCLLSACCFGTHVFRTEKRTASIDNKDLPGLISLELTLLTLLSGVYELVDFSLHNPGGLQALDVQKVSYSLAHLPWTNLAAMGMGTTALTLFIEINALQNISSTLASLIYTTEPLWGAFFAAVFLKEKFGGLGYLGAAMIVGSTAYATVKGGVVKQTEKVKVD
mmetsp:Transcript_31568/g.68235  ORF Transcript_31568/g.68235 Transcript_31568/m.68235 type:complete len:558 (+) Transcript_31568:323-1996(+)